MASVIEETRETAASALASEIRRSLGVTRKVLSRLTGYSERAIAGWESGDTPSGPGLQRLVEVQRLLDGLATVMKRDSVARWLDIPNPAFGQLKPVEVIERGQVDRIWRMIFEFQAGAAT